MPLKDYELGASVGAGAFGETFAGTRRSDGQPVALKVLALRGLPDWKPFERFEREAKTLRALDHEGVMCFLDAFDDVLDGERMYFIVSKRIDGKTLAELVEEGARWTDVTARALLGQLLETLHYLHSLSPRVLHRDIKPSNIMLAADDRPVLIDFGAVADLAAARADGSPTVIGTPGYMPPEQAMGQPDPRSDLYALGATMIHLLSHEHPSSLVGEGLRLQIPDTVGVSTSLSAVLRRLVEPDPGDRYDSAQAVLDALADPTTAESGSATALAVRPSTALQVQAAPRPLTPQVCQTLSISRATGFGRLAVILVASMLGVLSIVLLKSVAGMVLSLALFIAALLFVFLGGRGRVRSLYQNGRHVLGQVTSATADQRGLTTVTYEYQLEGEAHRYTGSFATSDALALQGIGRGSALSVFYAANRPINSTAMLPAELPHTDDS